MKMHHVKETIVRADEGGPAADVVCNEDGTEATATWIVPEGQLVDMNDAPAEIGTGGYVYFTLHSSPTDIIQFREGAQAEEFSGLVVGEEPISISAEVEAGVEYRAHILLAYEDGPNVHNDTVFVCEAPVAEATTTTVAQPTTTDTPDTLPFTGAAHADWMLPLALALVASGAAILGFTKRLFGDTE